MNTATLETRRIGPAEADLLRTLEILEGRRAELVRALARAMAPVPAPVPVSRTLWAADRQKALANVRRAIDSVRLALLNLEV